MTALFVRRNWGLRLVVALLIIVLGIAALWEIGNLTVINARAEGAELSSADQIADLVKQGLDVGIYFNIPVSSNKIASLFVGPKLTSQVNKLMSHGTDYLCTIASDAPGTAKICYVTYNIAYFYSFDATATAPADVTGSATTAK